MPTSYTSLLGFALPVTGELQGTWGTTVNDSITELVEDAIAATATASVTSGNWTLSTSGSGAANEARCAILIPTGTPGVSRNIIAPSQSKAYVVINQSDAAVVLKGAATTGVTIAAGDRAVVAWSGSDFVTIASTATDGVSTISFGTTGLTPNTATSGAVTVAGTLAVANGGTGQTTYTNGQLLIGNTTGNTLTKATLTAGSGVSITNGTGSITISATGSGGDIVGPASSTDNAIVRFDGTTGKLVQNSGVTIDDSGNVGIGITPIVALDVVGVIEAQAAATQDAIRLQGRAGGTGSFAVTLTPTTLSSNTTLTLPNVTSTIAALGATQTFTALQTFSGASSTLSSKFLNALEAITVSATVATGTINYDVTTQSIIYYTSNASANWTVNFRASGGTSLNSAMSTGESITVAFLVTQGSTPYYNNVVQVDGSTVTPKWQGGTAPTSGNASSIDAYVYSIVKTGSAAFTVFASQTKFA